jgi:acetylornithine deacetylase
MKGGAAANYFALKTIISIGLKLRGDVIIESVIDEETGGAGTAATLLRGYSADAAIITEPTDMIVCPTAMGSMWFRIKVKGKAAHGSTAYLGVNAIEKAHVIYKALKELEHKRLRTKQYELYNHLEIPFCINIGTISGGNWPSSVPDEVIMEGRMGVSPDESIKEAKTELKNAILEASTYDEWLSKNMPEVEWFGSCWVGGGIDKEHLLTQTLVKNHASILSNNPMISGAPWATDAGILIKYGGIPSVIYGPGKAHLAHQANEYVEIDDILNTIKVLSKSIIDWCAD